MELLFLILMTFLVVAYAIHRFSKHRKRRMDFYDEGHPDAYNQEYVNAMNETFKQA